MLLRLRFLGRVRQLLHRVAVRHQRAFDAWLQQKMHVDITGGFRVAGKERDCGGWGRGGGSCSGWPTMERVRWVAAGGEGGGEGAGV